MFPVRRLWILVVLVLRSAIRPLVERIVFELLPRWIVTGLKMRPEWCIRTVGAVATPADAERLNRVVRGIGRPSNTVARLDDRLDDTELTRALAYLLVVWCLLLEVGPYDARRGPLEKAQSRLARLVGSACSDRGLDRRRVLHRLSIAARAVRLLRSLRRL